MAKSAVTLCTWAKVLLEITNAACPVTLSAPANLESALTNSPVTAKLLSVATVAVCSTSSYKREFLFVESFWVHHNEDDFLIWLPSIFFILSLSKNCLEWNVHVFRSYSRDWDITVRVLVMNYVIWEPIHNFLGSNPKVHGLVLFFDLFNFRFIHFLSEVGGLVTRV